MYEGNQGWTSSHHRHNDNSGWLTRTTKNPGKFKGDCLGNLTDSHHHETR